MARYVGYKIGKVHESHTVSDYYCGRCGYPVTDHDSYCPECGGAFRECDADCLEDETRNLKAENAKLRGMLEEAWDCIKFGAACAGCSSWWRHGKLCKLMGFLRDIGIEVDPDVGRYGY